MSWKSVVLVGVLVGAGATAASMRVTAQEGNTTTTATFNKDVLPILQKNCQTCHRPGEIAPMSFLTYKDARPWAKAMKTAVVSRKMPPWFADPAYGHFANDRRLSDADIKTLVAWADGGAPEGDAKDKPAPVKFPEGWGLEAGHDHRDAEGRSAAGDRHHQLQEHPGQGELSGRQVGDRR